MFKDNDTFLAFKREISLTVIFQQIFHVVYHSQEQLKPHEFSPQNPGRQRFQDYKKKKTLSFWVSASNADNQTTYHYCIARWIVGKGAGGGGPWFGNWCRLARAVATVYRHGLIISAPVNNNSEHAGDRTYVTWSVKTSKLITRPRIHQKQWSKYQQHRRRQQRQHQDSLIPNTENRLAKILLVIETFTDCEICRWKENIFLPHGNVWKINRILICPYPI